MYNQHTNAHYATHLRIPVVHVHDLEKQPVVWQHTDPV
jgi:hypothetical protein